MLKTNWAKLLTTPLSICLMLIGITMFAPVSYANTTIFNWSYASYSNSSCQGSGDASCILLQNYGILIGNSTNNNPTLTIGTTSPSQGANIFSSIGIDNGTGSKGRLNINSTDVITGPVDFANSNRTTVNGSSNAYTTNANVATVATAAADYMAISSYWASASGAGITAMGLFSGSSIDVTAQSCVATSCAYIYTLGSTMPSASITFKANSNQLIIINASNKNLTLASGVQMTHDASMSSDQVLFNMRGTSTLGISTGAGTGISNVDADFIMSGAVTYSVAARVWGRIYGGNTGTVTYTEDIDYSTPEPSTVITLLTGLALIAAGCFRRNKAAQKKSSASASSEGTLPGTRLA